MNSANTNNNYKKPKHKTFSSSNLKNKSEYGKKGNVIKPFSPLLAKDSEWVDILQSSTAQSTYNKLDEEEILQLVDCENGLDKKPLAILFPSLLEKDPQTLKAVLNKAMSTTEVTKHLVDLGQKANFAFMKKTNRLIPYNKQWLESLVEVCQSNHSIQTEDLSTGKHIQVKHLINLKPRPLLNMTALAIPLAPACNALPQSALLKPSLIFNISLKLMKLMKKVRSVNIMHSPNFNNELKKKQPS